jgi:proteic killer suppression protein
LGVIRSFASGETERVWGEEYSRKLPANVQKLALRKLRMLDAASRLESLRVPPGNRLEALRGERVGQYSIRINNQWRICFEWRAGDAYRVEIVDYH